MSAEQVKCIMLSISEDKLVLPNAAIAEVVVYKEPTPVDDAPEWFLGYIEWRDKRVPLISFEAMSGKGVEAPVNISRIVVLNTINGNAQLPYVGVLSQGIPSLLVVPEGGLEDKAGDNENRQAVGAFIDLDGAEAVIPDLDEIEQRLTRLSL